MIEALLHRAQEQLQAGRIDAAADFARRALATSPRDARAFQLMAIVARLLHQTSKGLAHVAQAIVLNPRDARLFYLQALLHQDARNAPAAVTSLRQAVKLQPAFAEAQHDLGVLLAEAGEWQAAHLALQRALQARPDFPPALCNLGKLLRDLGQLEEAEQAYRQAVELQPHDAVALFHLGLTLSELDRRPEAISTLRRALQIEPKNTDAVLVLADCLRREERREESTEVLGFGLQHSPADERIRLAFAFDLAYTGAIEKARANYSEAWRRRPQSLAAALGAELTLAPIYTDREAIATARERYRQGLERLHDEGERFSRLSLEEVLDALQRSNFYLAYQGEDDRALQERYATFVRQMIQGVAPELLEAPAPLPRGGRRLRVGFASSFFCEGTVGDYFGKWISALDPARFETYLYHLRPDLNPYVHKLAARAQALRALSERSLADIAAAIRGDRLDVLIYPELGMDGRSFLLAALRLAPVQCAAWGHPVTSGHATIDYYFSSDAMEPPGGEAHYTEKLFRLPGIGTSYPRPPVPPDADRASLGLPLDAELLLLPQSPFKIHPDNDSLVAQLLSARPQAKLVLFNGPHRLLTERLLRRLGKVLEGHGVDAATRVIVLPFLKREDYLRVNLASDLMLDTLHWSGGNTSLDALACGLPMVTLPGRYLRGRQSAAMLRLMGAPEWVARDEADYLDIAAGVLDGGGNSSQRRSALREQAGALFDRKEPLAALAEFLETLESPTASRRA